MVRLSVVVDLSSLALVLAVVGDGGEIVGVLGALLRSRVRGFLIPMVWMRWEIEVAGIMMTMQEVAMVAAVLLLLASTLVRVMVRLVVGGALAPYSPRDPFADNAWGVWRAGGVSETTARMFVLCLRWGEVVVGLVLIVLEALYAVLRRSLILVKGKRGGLAL